MSTNYLVDEILLSSDKTIAIIDGSGVLADPAGLNREELIRLAKLRVTVAHFDKTKLSKDGYLVKVEDQDVKLPCMSDFLNVLWCLTLFFFSRRDRSRRYRFQEWCPLPFQGRPFRALWWTVSLRHLLHDTRADDLSVPKLSTSPMLLL